MLVCILFSYGVIALVGLEKRTLNKIRVWEYQVHEMKSLGLHFCIGERFANFWVGIYAVDQLHGHVFVWIFHLVLERCMCSGDLRYTDMVI